MSHWLEKVLEILQADTSDLRKLAIIAGGDPRTFYRGISASEVDIANQDITDMKFRGGFTGHLRNAEPAEPGSIPADPDVFSAESEFGPFRPDMDFYYSSIQTLLSAQRFKEALPFAREALELYPEEAIFWRLAATVYRRLHDKLSLGETLTQAYRRFPEEVWVSIQYCQYLLSQDDVDIVVGILRPLLARVELRSAKFEILQVLARADRLSAIEEYSSLLVQTDEPKSRGKILLELVDLQLLTQQPEIAIQNLRAAQEFPSVVRRTRYFEVLARALQFTDLQSEAILSFQNELAKSGPDISRFSPFLSGLIREGMRVQVIDILDEFERRYGPQPDLLKSLADVFWKFGERQAAIGFIKRVESMQQNLPGPTIWLIGKLLQMGNLAEGLFEARTALQNGIDLGQKLMRKLVVLAATNAEAIDVLRIAHEAKPQSTGYAAMLAAAYTSAGFNKEARTTWLLVAELVKQNGPPGKWIRRLLAKDKEALSIADLRTFVGPLAYKKEEQS